MKQISVHDVDPVKLVDVRKAKRVTPAFTCLAVTTMVLQLINLILVGVQIVSVLSVEGVHIDRMLMFSLHISCSLAIMVAAMLCIRSAYDDYLCLKVSNFYVGGLVLVLVAQCLLAGLPSMSRISYIQIGLSGAALMALLGMTTMIASWNEIPKSSALCAEATSVTV